MRKLGKHRSSLAYRTQSVVDHFVKSSDAGDVLFEYEPDRPKVRADCLPGGVNAQRPCPWASCRQHLATLVSKVGGLREVEGWMEDGGPTCVLDVVDERGELTLEEVAALWGLTRERVRQIEVDGFRHMLVHGVDLRKL